jgi:DnaJ family protein C protein 1
VLMFLVILTSGLEYLVQKVNYRRDLEKIRQTMRDARMAAWGPKMVPLEERRKVSGFHDCGAGWERHCRSK